MVIDYLKKFTFLSKEEIDHRLQMLEEACRSGSDDLVRSVLKQVVPTYKSPDEVNAKADQSDEMKMKNAAAVV